MRISLRNFESKTETISANRIRAEVTSGIYVDLFKNGMRSLNVNYLYDSDALNNERHKMFDKCLEIGIKKKYTEEERKFVNDYYIFALAVNVMSPKVISNLVVSNSVGNFMNKGYPILVLFFENYEMGFEDVIKPCFISKELTIDYQKISVSCAPLTQKEIKKFISYLSKNTYNTFNITLVDKHAANSSPTA